MPEGSAIVIGAGIVGLATARALAEQKWSVKVFDRSPVAVGASVRNFGMVWPVGQPKGKLYDRAMRSRAVWAEIAPQAGIWHDPVGSLHVAYRQDEWTVLEELFELFNGQGRKVELLKPDAVFARSPLAKRQGCLGGLFSPDELIVDPRKAIGALPDFLAKKYGIDFHFSTAVNQVTTGAVYVNEKKYAADLVFVCSGSDFETLYPDRFAAAPITKCKLQMMRFFPATAGSRIGPALCGGLSLTHYKSFSASSSLATLQKRVNETMPEYVKWGIHVMVSQNEPGEMTIGDSHEYGLSPDPFDRVAINRLILDYLDSFANMEGATAAESWNGVYAKLTNGGTEFFESPEPGVHILTATSGAGMTLSFGLAEEMVESVLG